MSQLKFTATYLVCFFWFGGEASQMEFATSFVVRWLSILCELTEITIRATKRDKDAEFLESLHPKLQSKCMSIVLLIYI